MGENKIFQSIPNGLKFSDLTFAIRAFMVGARWGTGRSSALENHEICIWRLMLQNQFQPTLSSVQTPAEK